MKACRRSTVLGVVASGAAAFFTSSVIWTGLLPRVARADDTLNGAVEEAFVFAGTQLAVLADDVLVELGVFTDYTDTDGLWITETDDDTIDQTVWTSGMVAGLFWYQYEATGDAIWKTRAEFFNEGLEGVEKTDDNDLGFQVHDSFGLGYRLTGDPDYKDRVLTGAETLYERYEENIPAFWSWSSPKLRPDWERAVNVDMMMNMEIMLWAGENGGDEAYTTAVAGHAETTWKDIVRDADNSTYHVADYDVDTGALNDQGTYQGWTNDSTWSRGQAWAVYGYVMVYRFLPDEKYLSMSLGLLGYFEDNLPSDFVPPADFDAPESSKNGKDSSASAIVASALIEIFLATDDPAYLVKAQEFLSALLTADYYLPLATDGWQSILRRATARWGDPEVGAIFGDYFLLETMVRYQRLAPSILLWQEAEVEVSSDATRRRLQVLTGGEFCALDVSSGAIKFADADCIPVAPDLSAIEAEATPAPTTASRDTTGGTPAPSSAEPLTLAPDAPPGATLAPAVVTLSPSPASDSTLPPEASAAPAAEEDPSLSPVATLPPAAEEDQSLEPATSQSMGPVSATSAPSGTQAPVGAGGGESVIFEGTLLDNDVDLSYLNATATVSVWLSVTLDNASNTPSSVVLESGAGDIVTAPIAEPTAGWSAGDNKVRFTVTPDAFVVGTWGSVSSVTVVFEASAAGTAAGETTAATINWLVLGNELTL